jgi:hypothetical protein
MSIRLGYNRCRTGGSDGPGRRVTASIEWARLCETAFLDRCDRLCLIGVITHFPVPSLPVAVTQFMIAAHVVDVRLHDEVEVGVSVTTPQGLLVMPDGPAGFHVEVAGEYLLITLRQMPLTAEGVYRFLVSVGVDTEVTLDVPVLVVSNRGHAEIH